MKQYFVLLFACMALWGCGGQDQIENPAFENNRPDRLLARAHPGQLLVATSRQAHIGYTPCPVSTK